MVNFNNAHFLMKVQVKLKCLTTHKLLLRWKIPMGFIIFQLFVKWWYCWAVFHLNLMQKQICSVLLVQIIIFTTTANILLLNNKRVSSNLQ